MQATIWKKKYEMNRFLLALSMKDQEGGLVTWQLLVIGVGKEADIWTGLGEGNAASWAVVVDGSYGA